MKMQSSYTVAVHSLVAAVAILSISTVASSAIAADKFPDKSIHS